MGWLLLIAFIGVPLIEIAVFIKIGGIVGLGPTLVIVVLTAVIGTALLRRQGLATLNRARQQMDQGSLPLAEIFDAICLLVAGAFLLTPGFVTDGLGALLLVPVVRLALRRFIGARVQMTNMHGHPGQDQGRDPDFSAQSDVIDGDYADVTDTAAKPSNEDQSRLDDRP